MDQSPISYPYCQTNSETSGFSEQMADDFNSCPSETNSPVCWPGTGRSPYSPTLSRFGGMRRNEKMEKNDNEKPTYYELEMMKERFSKLLLGEDMSGSGKGVSTAVTVSNAITNLYVSMFGQHQRLEPLYRDKKMMWKREMTCLLSVCDYIVEFVPASQNRASIEMMISRPRSDIDINLPALIKLDALLIEILKSFQETEFWYDEQGSMSRNSRTGSFRQTPQPQRNEEKWWLPVPCVSAEGLSEPARKHLRQKSDAANQIHKAAMAINNSILSDMEIPRTYTASLPKIVLSPPDVHIEAKGSSVGGVKSPKLSWEEVKEHMEGDKNVMLAERAEILLFRLKQRFPELAQTTLDTRKIQYNKVST
ncbi:Rop guanine nucleotide exchange factor 3-like protein [Tanacetum coccineum]